MDRSQLQGNDMPLVRSVRKHATHVQPFPSAGNTLLSFNHAICISVTVFFSRRLVKNWWWRESVREYLPILAVNEPSLINWLNQYGYAKVCIKLE